LSPQTQHIDLKHIDLTEANLEELYDYQKQLNETTNDREFVVLFPKLTDRINNPFENYEGCELIFERPFVLNEKKEPLQYEEEKRHRVYWFLNPRTGQYEKQKDPQIDRCHPFNNTHQYILNYIVRHRSGCENGYFESAGKTAQNLGLSSATVYNARKLFRRITVTAYDHKKGKMVRTPLMKKSDGKFFVHKRYKEMLDQYKQLYKDDRDSLSKNNHRHTRISVLPSIIKRKEITVNRCVKLFQLGYLVNIFDKDIERPYRKMGQGVQISKKSEIARMLGFPRSSFYDLLHKCKDYFCDFGLRQKEKSLTPERTHKIAYTEEEKQRMVIRPTSELEVSKEKGIKAIEARKEEITSVGETIRVRHLGEPCKEVTEDARRAMQLHVTENQTTLFQEDAPLKKAFWNKMYTQFHRYFGLNDKERMQLYKLLGNAFASICSGIKIKQLPKEKYHNQLLQDICLLVDGQIQNYYRKRNGQSFSSGAWNQSWHQERYSKKAILRPHIASNVENILWLIFYQFLV